VGKLIDTLHRAGKAFGPSIGFGINQSQASGKLKAAALIADTAADEAAISAVLKAGADALILPAGSETDAAKASEVAWGIDLRSQTPKNADALKKLHGKGADFILLAQTTSFRPLNERIEHLERVLTITPPTDDPFLINFRAYNLVEADIAILDLKLSARRLAELTVESFAHLRLYVETLRFPTIITLADEPAKEDFATLVRLGAQGIWLPGAKPEAITSMRVALENVPREKELPPSVSGLGNNSTLGNR
jgi:hypothetical protein